MGFLGSEWGSKSDLGSTHVVEQLLLCIHSSIPTFDFALNLGSFFTFWGSNGLFWGQGGAQKLFWGLLI